MASPLSCESIDAFAFDAYGTLFDTSAAVVRCQESVGERAAQLTALWRTKQLEYSWLRSLRGDYVDFWSITGESLDYAMAATGIEDAGLRSRLMESYFVLDPYPETRSVLERIKMAGIKTAILSNGSPSMLTGAASKSGIAPWIDAIISADTVQIYKPHPKVYQLACDELRVNAERMCFVSSNPWDVSGAALFGFRVIWVNRSGGVLDVLPGQPERIIETLDALPEMFEL